jgi:hypothetical protein
LTPASRITLRNSACAAFAASRFTGLSYSDARGCSPPIIRLVPSGSQTITTSAGSFSCSCRAAPSGGILRWWCRASAAAAAEEAAAAAEEAAAAATAAEEGLAVAGAAAAAAGTDSASDSPSGSRSEGGASVAGGPAPPASCLGAPSGLRAPSESGATAATSRNDAEYRAPDTPDMEP